LTTFVFCANIFEISFFKNKKEGGRDMHIHFGEPVIVDGDYFQKLVGGKTGVALIGDFWAFDVDNPTEADDITGRKVGEVIVISTKLTTIAGFNSYDLRDIKSLGFRSKEETTRTFNHRYGKNVRWVTITKFLVLSKQIHRLPGKEKEAKDG